jgi:hypothetical protein
MSKHNQFNKPHEPRGRQFFRDQRPTAKEEIVEEKTEEVVPVEKKSDQLLIAKTYFNLRQRPDFNAPLLKVFSPGDKLRVEIKESPWLKTTCVTTKLTGFIHESVLR